MREKSREHRRREKGWKENKKKKQKLGEDEKRGRITIKTSETNKEGVKKSREKKLLPWWGKTFWQGATSIEKTYSTIKLAKKKDLKREEEFNGQLLGGRIKTTPRCKTSSHSKRRKNSLGKTKKEKTGREDHQDYLTDTRER